MKVLVCGSRHLRDWRLLFQTLDELNPQPTVIIHGDAKGADIGAEVWAKTLEYRSGEPCPEVQVFPADWKKHGLAAGPIRNQEMLDKGKPDLVVAFMGPNSRGTKHMVTIAQKQGVETIVVDLATTLAPTPDKRTSEA